MPASIQRQSGLHPFHHFDQYLLATIAARTHRPYVPLRDPDPAALGERSVRQGQTVVGSVYHSRVSHNQCSSQQPIAPVSVLTPQMTVWDILWAKSATGQWAPWSIFVLGDGRLHLMTARTPLQSAFRGVERTGCGWKRRTAPFPVLLQGALVPHNPSPHPQDIAAPRPAAILRDMQLYPPPVIPR